MSELSKTLETLGIKITSTHIRFDEQSMQDKWAYVVSFEGRSATFDYYTGIGHRKIPSYMKKERSQWWDSQRHVYRTEVEMARWNISRTTQPNVADVVHCLLLDSGAICEAFTDWCDNLGYDSDSRKALDTYLQCQANGVKLRSVIGSKMMSELQGLEH